MDLDLGDSKNTKIPNGSEEIGGDFGRRQALPLHTRRTKSFCLDPRPSAITPRVHVLSDRCVYRRGVETAIVTKQLAAPRGTPHGLLCLCCMYSPGFLHPVPPVCPVLLQPLDLCQAGISSLAPPCTSTTGVQSSSCTPHVASPRRVSSLFRLSVERNRQGARWRPTQAPPRGISRGGPTAPPTDRPKHELARG